MKQQILFLFLPALLIFMSQSLFAEQRTWTDEKGRTIQAEFVRLDPTSDEVIFRKNTGKVYRFPLNQLAQVDQNYVRNLLQTSSSEPSDSAKKRTDFEKSITKHLVRNINGQIKELQEADLGAKDYYAIYYSAHWCPPCRKFTPRLVSFYNNYSKKHDNFEIIFVSNDRNEMAMENYIKEAKMPWPALKFDENKQQHPATNYSGNGIPSLVLIDNNGNVLADSYSGNQYVGPDVVMNTLKEKLNQQ